jgi:hypothetical protein
VKRTSSTTAVQKPYNVTTFVSPLLMRVSTHLYNIKSERQKSVR